MLPVTLRPPACRRRTTLEQVYGAITFYLGSKEEVEADVAERERVEDEFAETHQAPADLRHKLDRARQQLLARRS